MIFNTYPARLGTGQNILSRTRNLQKATSSYFEDRKLMGLLGLDLIMIIHILKQVLIIIKIYYLQNINCTYLK